MWIEIIITLFLLFIIWNITKKPSDYPPGIWGFPIIGYIPYGMKNFQKKFEELKKKHGQIFCWKIGSKLLIFVNDYKIMKDAFQTIEYADRPPLSFFNFMIDEFDTGVIFTNGTQWHNIRRFTLRHLRDLGMGKSKLVSSIQYEASEVVESLKKDAGKPKPLSTDVKIAIINVLWQMVADIRFKFDDETILEFDRMFTILQGSFGKLILLDFFPWLKTILPKSILDSITNRHNQEHLKNLVEKAFQGYVDEHKKTLDENNPRDYIDSYLIEMEAQKSNPDSTMSNRDLIGSIADLFAAGYATTAIAVTYSIYYMVTFPEVQKKLQKEIDEVLGKTNQATLEDKSRLPYTEAFINETLRYSSQTPFNIPRTVARDTKLEKYTIPKNSIILPVAEGMHMDSEYFDSPKEFRPERFLNNGKFEVPKSGYYPFGIGKRQCIGESLAKMELLIFLTTMVQRLEFSAPEGKPVDLRPEDFAFFNLPRYKEDIVISVRS